MLCTQMKKAKATISIISLLLSVDASAENIWVKAKEGNWELSRETLTAMKTDIEVYTKNEAKAQGRELLDWNRYMFQYLAREVDGQKNILVNALCVKESPRELVDYLLTAGGGNCYFSLKYDPEKNGYYGLFVNGST